MYEVRVQACFSAAHQVRLYDGGLEPIHGHDWRVEAVFRGPELDRIGVLVDFVAAEAALREVTANLHHTRLNDLPFFADVNPTAENLARWVFERLAERLGPDAPLVGVYVREAPGCVAGYRVS
ncbi:MAG: 6-carboxy-5,6,7,8-tetrahydropterin synthase [Phycisphaerae bacterium]